MATDGQKRVSRLKNLQTLVYIIRSLCIVLPKNGLQTSDLEANRKKKAFHFKPFLLVVLKLRCLSVLSLRNVRQAGVVWHYGIH